VIGCMDDITAKKAKIGDLVRESYDSGARRGYGIILTKTKSPSGVFHMFHVHWFRPKSHDGPTDRIIEHSEWDLMVYDP